MSRVINANAPGTVRNRHRRTIAELLHHMSHRSEIDAEVKDMAAAIVFALRGIHQSVMQTVQAWEKRDYWTKADRFMRDWEWVTVQADGLEEVLTTGRWAELPGILMSLMPHFIDIETKKLTRAPSEWQGALDRLLREKRSAGM